MKALFAVALVSASVSSPRVAAADAWPKRCAAIFATARAELMTSDPLFQSGKVTTDTKPRAGKQTLAEAKRPIVSFALGKLGTNAGDRSPLYLATISPTTADDETDRQGWMTLANKTYSGFDLRERRTLRAREAFVGGRDVQLTRLQRFIDRFRRAADDCLQLSAPSPAPRSSPAPPSR